MNDDQMSRRGMLQGAVAGGLSLTSLASVNGSAPTRPKKSQHKICAFTKPFQSLSFQELSDRMKEVGFDGIEGTIRKGGHIEPEEVPDKLPEMVEALKKNNLELTIMASSINQVTPLVEKQLQTASKLGIKRYRVQYYTYNLKKPLIPQLREAHKKARDLAQMNAELGITACYQNHAGAKYVGAPIWDLEILLNGIPPEHFGVAFDIRHATVEGGTTWETHFALIKKRIQIIYVKDFRWVDGNRKPVNVPLGSEGSRVDTRFFKLLAQSGYQGPISLHEEYLNHRDPKEVPKHLQAMKKDLKTLNSWIQ